MMMTYDGSILICVWRRGGDEHIIDTPLLTFDDIVDLLLMSEVFPTVMMMILLIFNIHYLFDVDPILALMILMTR